MPNLTVIAQTPRFLSPEPRLPICLFEFVKLLQPDMVSVHLRDGPGLWTASFAEILRIPTRVLYTPAIWLEKDKRTLRELKRAQKKAVFSAEVTGIADIRRGLVEPLQEGDTLLLVYNYEPPSSGGGMKTFHQSQKHRQNIIVTHMSPSGHMNVINGDRHQIIQAEFNESLTVFT